MSELESLASRASQLASKVDFWNSAVLWSLLITALAAAAIVFSQRLAFVRAKQLSDVQEKMASIKEANTSDRADNLDQANLRIRSDLEKETGKVADLDKHAADAKAAQQKVEIELAKEQERAAIAERALLELQERIKDRHLTEEKRGELVAFLTANPKGEISVSCVGGNPEPCAFAAELVDALRAGGWTVTVFNQGVIFVGASPSGLIVEVQSAEKTPQRAIVLQRALQQLGFPAAGQLSPEMVENAVILVIGSKP